MHFHLLSLLPVLLTPFTVSADPDPDGYRVVERIRISRDEAVYDLTLIPKYAVPPGDDLARAVESLWKSYHQIMTNLPTPGLPISGKLNSGGCQRFSRAFGPAVYDLAKPLDLLSEDRIACADGLRGLYVNDLINVLDILKGDWDELASRFDYSCEGEDFRYYFYQQLGFVKRPTENVLQKWVDRRDGKCAKNAVDEQVVFELV